jgi:hypothetical protein
MSLKWVHQSQEIEKWMTDDAKESRKLGTVLASPEDSKMDPHVPH